MSGDARLLHQVHPAKLATDISAELVSGVLLWRQQPAWGLAVHFLPPIVASAVVLHWVDVEALRNHPGRPLRPGTHATGGRGGPLGR
jgi:hypothetical protein